MAVDFNKFDKLVNQEQLKKDIEKASEQTFDDVPEGEYIVSIENMEVKETNARDKLMISFAFKIKETLDAPKKQNGRFIFMNRVIYGNKVSDRWNDGVAIHGVLGWLKDLGEIEFKSYTQFAHDIEELFEELQDSVELQISYSPDEFYPVSIIEVFDLN